MLYYRFQDFSFSVKSETDFFLGGGKKTKINKRVHIDIDISSFRLQDSYFFDFIPVIFYPENRDS